MLVEYAFLLMTIAIPATAGLLAGGAQLLTQYQSTRNTVIENVP